MRAAGGLQLKKQYTLDLHGVPVAAEIGMALILRLWQVCWPRMHLCTARGGALVTTVVFRLYESLSSQGADIVYNIYSRRQAYAGAHCNLTEMAHVRQKFIRCTASALAT